MISTPPIYRFDGDCSTLPFAAHIRYGQVPTHPSADDFQNAVLGLCDDFERYAEAHWQIEAIRWRRSHPGKPLNLGLTEIEQATVKRIFRVVTAQ